MEVTLQTIKSRLDAHSSAKKSFSFLGQENVLNTCHMFGFVFGTLP